eukprot:Skav227385  [mRNA]  locus=scaffold3148:48971:50886:+ [translate_table: standard]
MLPSAQTDLWDETLLRTAARAFRAWRHAVAQARQEPRRSSAAARSDKIPVASAELMAKASKGLRRSPLVLCLCAVVFLLGFAPSFVTLPGRRSLLAGGLLLGVGSNNAPALAAGSITQADKDRLTRGYKEMVYMMKNWNTVTRKCEKNQENIQRALQSGQASPDGCIANPLIVRKYLGQTSIKADLFNTKDLLVNMELAGLVPSKLEDEFGDLVEDFEAFKRQSDEWAYSSSWAEANPGGGRDRTEDYLLRSKSLADKATKTLGRIVEILGLSENLYV